MHGDSLQSYLVAVAIPDFDVLRPWFEVNHPGKDTSDENLCESQEVKELIIASLNELAFSNKFNGLEKVKKVYLHPEPFSEENDLMTPSSKLKRNVSVQRFRA